MLELVRVQKSYGRTLALQDLSLAVRPREIVGLLGPNGAGKTTLFQIAAGLLRPDAGDVSAFGLSYERQGLNIRRRLGLVFQSRSLDLDMSVRANLSFHGRLFGLSGRRLQQRIGAVAELLQLESLLAVPLRRLSGGNQRRAEVARALLHEPELLLLDEATAGLDAAARLALRSHIEAARSQLGTSTLWATHLVEEVENADRIAIIVTGRLIASGTPADLCERTGSRSASDAYLMLLGSQGSPRG